MWAKIILRDARDAGVASATLYSAKSALRIRSEKFGVEGWQWSLPPKEDPDPSSGHKVQDLRNLRNGRGGGSPQFPYISEGDGDIEGYEGGGGEAHDHHLPEDSRGSKGSATPRGWRRLTPGGGRGDQAPRGVGLERSGGTGPGPRGSGAIPPGLGSGVYSPPTAPPPTPMGRINREEKNFAHLCRILYLWPVIQDIIDTVDTKAPARLPPPEARPKEVLP